MSKSELSYLATKLENYIASPQKSERWAMYRLIAPVVDRACAINNWLAYFEYNQTSRHGASQSIDIALLRGEIPMVMIEAKRVDRDISSGQVSKYLDVNTRGIVTNGIDWILCDQGKTSAIRIINTDKNLVSLEALELLIHFIVGGDVEKIDWKNGQTEVRSWVSPNRPEKARSARRVSSEKTIITDPREVSNIVLQNKKLSAMERILLSALFEKSEVSDTTNSKLRFEAREGRVSIFDSNLKSGLKRICRIAIGMQKPEVILLAVLPRESVGLDSLVKPFEHDKGSHMMCYRLATEEQSRLFGHKLGELLFENQR